MSDKVKERIEMEARQYAMKHSSAPDKETPDWIIQDYIAGATAEHPIAWNEAIDAVLGRLTNYTGAFEIREHYNSLRYEIEQLKHKQP